METVKYCALDPPPPQHNTAPPQALENLMETVPPQTTPKEAAATQAADRNWEYLSLHDWSTVLSHIKLYLDNFIRIVKSGSEDRRKMMQHLFRDIEELFRPNTKDDTACEDPISLK